MTKSLIDRHDSLSAEIRAALDMPRAWGGGPVCRLGHWPGWFAPLGPEVPFTVAPIGFIFDHSSEPLPAEVQAFLEAGPPPVLITHGTSSPMDPAFFRASAAACEQVGLRGMLVTSHAEFVPDPLPAGVAWFRYVPYGSLLPRVRIIIHHGGLGTVGAAMQAAIPQLILPLGHDRQDNATNIRRLGVGDFLLLPQWRTDAIAAALGRLVSAPGVQERCREVAGWMQELDPVAVACDWIEGVLAGSPAAKRAAYVRRRQMPETVILESSLDAALRQRLSRLSPEKRALLAARLRRRIRTKPASDGAILETSQDAALRQQLRHLSPEKRALLVARLRRHDDTMTR